jgi:endonuclease-3
MTKAERARQLVKALPKAYPNAHCELDFKTPLQLLVATILSAQCTDKRVNLVTPALFARYRSAKDFAGAKPSELEKAIQSTSFFRNKAKSIRAAAAVIESDHKGKVPKTMAELKALPGVGRKTANVVLGNAFAVNEGIVVDTHVARLSERLGSREHWTDWSHWLIWHGRRRCFARKPDCRNCEVLKLCPSGPKFIRSEIAAPAKKS